MVSEQLIEQVVDDQKAWLQKNQLGLLDISIINDCSKRLK